MKLRLMADSDLRRAIVTGLLRRDPTIDFTFETVPDGTPDSEVLAIAAAADRVLVSHDVNTMPAQFLVFGRSSAGLLLIPQRTSTADAIERLLAFCHAVEHEELRDHIRFLP